MANIQLADNLRRLRKQYNYTQAQIGKKLHITHQAYSNYETGVREPNLQLLAELSWIYHTSVDSLITQYCNAKNPSSVEVKNYFCIKIENSENDILLTKNEVNSFSKQEGALSMPSETRCMTDSSMRPCGGKVHAPMRRERFAHSMGFPLGRWRPC